MYKSIHHSLGWSRRLQCLLSCRFLCIFRRFAKFSSIFLHSWVPLELTTGKAKLGREVGAVLALHAIQANDGLVPSQQRHQAICLWLWVEITRTWRMAIPSNNGYPATYRYTVDNGAWWSMAEKRFRGGGTACSRTLWSSTRYPSWWQDVRNTWRASKQAKNSWWLGYKLDPHIMFERGPTKLHRNFRMTHIDDANVIPLVASGKTGSAASWHPCHRLSCWSFQVD